MLPANCSSAARRKRIVSRCGDVSISITDGCRSIRASGASMRSRSCTLAAATRASVSASICRCVLSEILRRTSRPASAFFSAWRERTTFSTSAPNTGMPSKFVRTPRNCDVVSESVSVGETWMPPKSTSISLRAK